jgi:hypothetical protein
LSKLTYDSINANRFVKDMTTAGFVVQHYCGRFFWKGPAVVCDTAAYDDVVRATGVRLQRDQMGLGYLVYPRAPAELLDDPLRW